MVVSRVRFTPQERAQLWERWRKGESVGSISRVLERRNKAGVQRIVALHGGIAPAQQRKSSTTLELEEREEISRAGSRQAGRAGLLLRSSQPLAAGQ